MATKIVSGKTRQRIVVPDYKREEIDAYDADNSYPQRILDVLNASGVGHACTEIFARYTFGDGISDPNLSKRVVDRRGTTLDKMLRACVYDYCTWYGFGVHVQYNAFGQPISYTQVPFEYIRKGIQKKDGMFAVYDNWDKRDINEPYNIDKFQWIHKYNPSAVVREISETKGKDLPEKVRNYKGQLFYFSKAGYQYPLAPCDPVLEDVQTTYQIKLFKNKNIRTNFMASHAFVYKGKFESEDAREAFKADLEKYQGAEQVGNIMLIEAEYDEQIPQLLPFTIQNNDKLWEYTESSTVNNIIQNYLIPPVLIGVLQAGKLGTANEINDAHQFYNAYTESDRGVFMEEFTKLMGVPVVLIPKKAIYTIPQ
jgi:hypothetical protein